MSFHRTYLICLMLTLSLGICASAQASWRLDLPESVIVDAPCVRLSDVVSTPVPSAVGELILIGQGEAGSAVSITRQVILRKLVMAGLASGVIMQGSPEVLIQFQGSEVSTDTLQQEIRREIQHLVPPAAAGAPASWFDLTIPDSKLKIAGQLEIEVQRSNPMTPGRNQLRVRLTSEQGHQEIPVIAVLHCYGEIPTACKKIDRETPLAEGLFNWAWLDLAEVQGQLVTGREAIQGACIGRTLSAGDPLRMNDLKAIPLVRSGDMVELLIERGSLSVTVKALARQAGCLGQTIPVRNELNGRLVNARVTGPGVVKWRR